MTFVPIVTTTAATAAAQRHAEMLRREEEEMTRYAAADTEGWEFKIVRSASGKFRRPEVVRELVDEEAKSGWELLEKFDDNRIRFRRRVEHRADDAHRDGDPYRTQYGIGADRLGLLVALVILGVLALAGVVAYQFVS
jgi:hypothetical protein